MNWFAGIVLVAVLGISIATLVLSVQTYHKVSDHATTPDDADDSVERASLATLEKFSKLAGEITAADHAPLAPGETGRGFGAHLGPLRSARAMAIVHAAMVDTIAAGTGEFVPYTSVAAPTEKVALGAGIAAAARDTLLSLYPLYKQRIEGATKSYLVSIPNSRAKSAGEELGRRAAAAIIKKRANDGSAHAEPAAAVFESQIAGLWHRDPIAQHGVALGGLWAKKVTPFVIDRADQFRIPPPPALKSDEYTMEYYQEKAMGGDGINTTTVRDEWNTFVGNFWAFDGTPYLCAPPNLYLILARSVAVQAKLGLVEQARLIGAVAIGMADAGLAAWDSKYYYMRERPVTAVRQSAAIDGNNLTVSDPNWRPLGAPASNSKGPNFTPPFPAYPSGHAVFGAAVAHILAEHIGSDDFQFTFVSDEYNGTTVDVNGKVRPYRPRMFGSFSEMAQENAWSRIPLGIHWESDKNAGVAQGYAVGKFVAPRLYAKIHAKK